MTPEQFHDALRSFCRREPFVPYTLILASGERLEVIAPNAVAFDGGAASVYDAAGEITFVRCENVRAIVAASPEPAA